MDVVAKAVEQKPAFLIRRRSVISKESVSFTSDPSSCFSEKKNAHGYSPELILVPRKREINSPLLVDCHCASYCVTAKSYIYVNLISKYFNSEALIGF